MTTAQKDCGCAECGKKEKDGWYLYCVECMGKTALAQPAQEPVKMVAYNCTCGKTMKFESLHGVVAPQRTWVGLTDDEIETIYAECNVWDKFEYERMLEAKLKEKNT